ncbi:MAG: STAS domain-containing protein [Spongiibacteraceae bacterium]
MSIGVTSVVGSKGFVHLNCRFDFNCIREFKELYEPLLNDAGIKAIEINMGGVEYIDSTALGMLLALRDKSRGAKKTISISGCKGVPRQVLEVANFDKLFEIEK